MNNQVYQLNKMVNGDLGGQALIRYENEVYRLHLKAGVGVDVDYFNDWAGRCQEALRGGDAATGVRYGKGALDLYRGDLYGVEVGRTLIERERLRTLYLDLLVDLVKHYYGRRLYRQALSYIFRMLDFDPCHEGAHRLAMRCYQRMERRSQALHHYRVCCRALEAEYGSQPEPKTSALFEQIRTDPGGVAADEG